MKHFEDHWPWGFLAIMFLPWLATIPWLNVKLCKIPVFLSMIQNGEIKKNAWLDTRKWSAGQTSYLSELTFWFGKWT